MPVGSITNGVHLATWTHPRISALLNAGHELSPASFAKPLEGKRRAALWQAKQELKRELIRSGLAPLHFDAQTAECLDDAVFEIHLPRFMKRVPGVVLRPALWMLRLSNRSAWLKYTRTRMGFLLQKES